MRALSWAAAGCLLLSACVVEPYEGEEDEEPGTSSRGPAPGPTGPSPAIAGSLPLEHQVGALDVVGEFHESMPTGIAVAPGGRIFVAFPRWGDPVPLSVGELRDGHPEAYPTREINRLDPEHASTSFVSVQSLVVDPRNRLWVLDSGSIRFSAPIPGGAKLVAINLDSNRIEKTILFPPDMALPTSDLTDLRLDLRRGPEGVAFITDSSTVGPNGIVVIDLSSGECRRRLQDHPSTKAQPGFLPLVEGRPLQRRPEGQTPIPLTVGAEGIALSNDGKRLFYCPLASRRLYSVDADALCDFTRPDDSVAATVRDEGMKPASDGLESDAEGRIYATSYETNSIVRRNPDGTYETLVHDPHLLWPENLALGEDGYLYILVNQRHRHPDFNGGADLRELPYVLYRVKTEGTPLSLE
jgi:sugar lactone lactonase YvrE